MTSTTNEPTDTAGQEEEAPSRGRRGRRAGGGTSTSERQSGGRGRRSGVSYSEPIRNLFVSNPGATMSIAEVAESLSADRAAVGMGLSALARRGVLERVGTGQYRLSGSPGGPAPRGRGTAAARRQQASSSGRGRGRRAQAETPAEQPARGGRGRAAAVQPPAAAPAPQELGGYQPVFSLSTGEVILQDAEGGLWQAHRVNLVAEQ